VKEEEWDWLMERWEESVNEHGDTGINKGVDLKEVGKWSVGRWNGVCEKVKRLEKENFWKNKSREGSNAYPMRSAGLPYNTTEPAFCARILPLFWLARVHGLDFQ
ncbi:hypothetical protein HAX54_048259, partial [Datura stramonium]|nr:hypothetical protein [Datura stramonium]